MAAVRRYLWVIALAFSLAFIVLGAFFVTKGLDARAQVKAALAEQQITTGADAVKFGAAQGVLVQDAKTAKAQADTIKLHTLGAWGPYSQIPREDTRRATFVDGVALQSALNLAVLSFGVTDLAMGAGAVIILLGLANLLVAVPALYWARQAETQVVREVSRRIAKPATEPSY